jgi:hypothetical protein
MRIFHSNYVPDPDEEGPYCFNPIDHPKEWAAVKKLVNDVMGTEGEQS